MSSSSPLRALLDQFWQAAQTNREAGTYFEELTVAYLRAEPVYRDLYVTVETYAQWAERRGLDKRDTGIDLVAETASSLFVLRTACRSGSGARAAARALSATSSATTSISTTSKREPGRRDRGLGGG